MKSSRSLDELHVHALRQAADIVVRLDRHRGAAGEGDAFDDVRIERALGEEIGAAELLGLFLEDLDEETADDLALGLRIADAFELADEAIGSVDMEQMEVVVLLEHGDDVRRLVLAHQTMVDEDAGKLIPDRFVDEESCHG